MKYRSHEGSVLDDFCLGFQQYLRNVEVASAQVRVDHIPYVLSLGQLGAWNEVVCSAAKNGGIGSVAIPWLRSGESISYQDAMQDLVAFRNLFIIEMRKQIDERGRESI